MSNNSRGKQLSKRSIRAIIDGYLKAINLKHTPGRTLSAHSLRHTAATLAFRTGSDLRQVQDSLGHADTPVLLLSMLTVGDCVASRRHRWKHNPGVNVEKKLKL